MKYAVEALALIILGTIAATVVVLMFGSPSLKLAEGELRCEGAGAVIIKIAGDRGLMLCDWTAAKKVSGSH